MKLETKKKMIEEVNSAISDVINEYIEARHTKVGLLEYLQNYNWRFPKEYNEYYGENHPYFDIFDTQEHLDLFINEQK
jgi:hypothetical protein